MLSEAETKDNAAVLDKMERYFRYAADHPTWVTARKTHIKTFKYKEGEQWTDDELKELEKRGQPDTVNNLCAVTVNKLVGDMVDQKFRIGFRGRNAPADDEIAGTLSDIFLYIRQSNDLEFEERDMADDGFTCGFGVIEVFVTFTDDYLPEIRVRSQDSLSVFPDPDSKRYDWNQDAKFIARAQWFDIDEAKELYPAMSGQLEGLMSAGATVGGVGQESSGQMSMIDKLEGNYYVDQKKRRIRIIDMEYKKVKRETIVLFADGTSLPKEQVTKEVYAQAKANQIAYEEIDRTKPIICRGVFAGGLLLDHKETKRRLYSLVPYFVYRRKSGEPYSLLTLALSMQDAVNKRESKALHLLNTKQVLAEHGAIGDKDKLADELAQPDGIVEFPDGSLSTKRVMLEQNTELATSQFSMHEQAKDAFYLITSIDPRAAGSTGELRSGLGLKSKFQEANKPIVPIFDNLKRTRKLLGRVILDYVGLYWTAQKTFVVTEDQSKAKEVNISSGMFDRIRTGQYDVVIDDFNDSDSLQQEQFGMLLQYLPQILPYGPYWTKKLIQLSDLRNKDQWVQELEQQGGPPPIEPKVAVSAQLDALTPAERAFFYQRMGDPQLAQQIVQSGQVPTQDVKAAVDVAKTKLKVQADIHKTHASALHAGAQAHEKNVADVIQAREQNATAKTNQGQ